MKNKKGYFLSIDALIALILILTIVLIVRPGITEIQTKTQSDIQEDLLRSLSSVKIGDLDDTYTKELITQGKITNLNQSVLEQIGEFYAKSDPEANILAQVLLNNLSTNKNIGLYFNSLEIASSSNKPFANATNIWISRQIISGIQQGNSAKGFSSIASISSSNKIEYFYFGGYVGDGNISMNVNGNISNVEIEAEFRGNFDIYINDVYAGSHLPTLNTPYKFDLSNHLSKFIFGTNIIKFTGTTEKLSIAGGFAKISFNEEQTISSITKKYFAGIDGLINIYDSFLIPGSLNALEIFLHYNASRNIFLTIGNQTVYRGNSSSLIDTVTVTDSQLKQILDYSTLTGQTIPIRLGLENSSFFINETLLTDVYSVTDLSGSMSAGCHSAGIICCLFTGDFCTNNNSCDGCNGVLDDKIGLAKEANKVFIDSLASSYGNRIGLVGYQTTAPEDDYHALSDDTASLKAKVDEWKPKGGTSICAGINKAVEKMQLEGRTNVTRSMVVMSDGKANVKCTEQGTGAATTDAIQAACDAFNNHNILVHAVGFGEDADELTLQSIASCGKGTYYYSDVSNLIGIYAQIAQDVVNASFVEQTIIAHTLHTELFPDSYISIDFNKTLPFGVRINTETPAFQNLESTGTVFVPNDTTPFEFGVVSYSGARWTDKVQILNKSTGIWETIFNLSDYQRDFIEIGDPFITNLPIGKITKGNNTIRVTTALGPKNDTPGSANNKIIYTLMKDISSFSPIVSSASGCIWNIEFEDSTNLSIKVPMSYSGNRSCSFDSNSVAYNENDAIDLGVFNLLQKLDLNKNQKIETKFGQSDLQLTTTEVTGIPFTWDTEVQARVWQ